MATQTNEPVTSTAHSDNITYHTNNRNDTSTRMSGGASSDKSVTFSPTPATSPAREKSQAEAEALIRDKKDKSRAVFKRSLSSLWKMLDPPELAHNTGALHNLVKAEEDNYKREKTVDSMILRETIASRQYNQR